MRENNELGNEYGELKVVNVRLVKEPSILSERPVTNTDDAVALIRNLISQYDREVFAVLNLAADGTPISMNIASVGTLQSAIISPREVFKSAILSNAAAFIGFHCHPSGNVRPSRDDAITTKRLMDAGNLLDIRMLDHIIVGCGNGKQFSFMTNGLMTEDIIQNYEKLDYRREWER